MCGILGIMSEKKVLANVDLKRMIDKLMILSSSRGKEASGIVSLVGSNLRIYKEAVASSELIKTASYDKFFNKLSSEVNKCSNNDFISVLGHSRLATHGHQLNFQSNQPVLENNILAIHNGIIVNAEVLWKQKLKRKTQLDVDSQIIVSLVDNYISLVSDFEEAVRQTLSLLEGSVSTSILDPESKKLILATNTGSLFWSVNVSKKLYVFASEKNFLETFIREEKEHTGQIFDVITQIKPNQGMVIDLEGGNVNVLKNNRDKKGSRETITNKTAIQIEKIVSDMPPRKIVELYSFENKLKNIKKHKIEFDKISKIRRCVRCILPETMPLIRFNYEGVCNFCLEYKPIDSRGLNALMKYVEPFRSKNGQVDCLVALSGGRDSSYGLHFVKKVLEMNPIAYTYDWGMVTDLGRRNQARMVGKLGVEHVLVSADITKKRSFVRKHILAWTKKPDLGMVPLFMSGDKQCEYYADDLSQKTGVKLIFYCRGNKLENEEFKWGHCGITDATPQGVIHNLSLKGKAQLLTYYAKQYLFNPNYINSSLIDTLFAFFSTYIQQHDYVYLWHYIPWEEKKIISTLTNQYDWETPADTKQTWRIDDATAPFYNYVYLQVQGFCENDTFRSNQIREGIISREEALKLVLEENQPRYKAMQSYFDKVGIDGDMVLTVVDRIPKLY